MKIMQSRLGALFTLVLALSVPAFAGDSTQRISIQPQPLQTALVELAEQADIVVFAAAEVVKNHAAPAVSGQMSTEAALTQLLAGTDLSFQQQPDGTYVIAQAVAADNPQSSTQTEVTRPKMIEEVIVTAQKREQSVYDVPISILAFGNEDIKAQKLTDFEDLALAVPGLVVQSSNFQRRIFMRGLGNLAGGSSMVGIYVDETSASAGGVVAQQLDLRMQDLERVEVLRGPQGTIYGQGSMSGTIRFITKNPQLDSFGFNADVETSFTQDGDPGQKIQAVANIPLINNELGLRIAGTYEHGGGWIDQPVGELEDINDQNLVNVRVKGLWQPTEALTANVSAIIHRNEGGVSLEQSDGNITPAFNVLTPPSFDDEYEIYSLTLSYDFNNTSLVSASNYVNTKKIVRNVSGPFRPPYFTADSLTNPLTTDGDVFNQELRLSSNNSGPWQWTIGGFYEDWEIDSANDFYLGFVLGSSLPAVPTSTDQTFTSKSWAVFGNTSFELTSRLEIGAGLRYFEDERETTNHVSGAFNSADFDTLNPRLFLNYDLTDGIKVYSSAAKGFRSGGTASFSVGAFDPDEVWTYELGAKGSLLDGRLTGDMAIFYTDYSDVIVRVLLPGQFSAFDTNAGDAEIRGIEWSFTWQAGDDLRLGFLGTYVDTEYTSVIGTQRTHLPGDPLDLVKNYQFTLWAEHDFVWVSRPGSIRMDYNEQGPSKYTINNFPLFAESDIINMLNIHVNWAWSDQLSLGFFAQNLLNDRGTVEPLFFGVGDGVWKSTRSRPRTLGMEFSVSF